MSTTPTPQSDQAATTPGRAEELAAWLDAEANMLREQSYSLRMNGAFGPAQAVGDSALTLDSCALHLRAQSAELLALRADANRYRYIKENQSLINNNPDDLDAAIDAALNSPTQGAK